LKKLKDPDTSLHVACADSIGLIVHHTLKNIESKDEQFTTLGDILKTIYG